MKPAGSCWRISELVLHFTTPVTRMDIRTSSFDYAQEVLLRLRGAGVSRSFFLTTS